MRHFTVIFLLGIFITSAYGQTGLEEVKQLLEHLEQDTQNSIDEMTDFWNAQGPVLLTAIQALKGTEEAQGKVCRGIDASISEVELDAEKTTHFIELATNRTTENNAKVETLEKQRCKATNLYIDGLMNDKISLKLIAVLKEAIGDKDAFNPDQQKKAFAQIKVLISSMHRNNELKNKLNEIDGKQVPKIDLLQSESMNSTKPWWQLKQEILAILNQLESEINANSASGQENQVNASVSLAEFKIHVWQETRELEQANKTLSEKLENLQPQWTKLQEDKIKCQEVWDFMQGAVMDANFEYNIKKDQYAREKADKANEKGVLREIKNSYIDEVYSEDVGYQNRVDDGADDGLFQNKGGHYGNPELDQFDVGQI